MHLTILPFSGGREREPGGRPTRPSGCNGGLDRNHRKDFGVVDTHSAGERESVRDDPVWRVRVEGCGRAAEVVEGLRADLLEEILRGESPIPGALGHEGLLPDAVKETVGLRPSAVV